MLFLPAVVVSILRVSFTRRRYDMIHEGRVGSVVICSVGKLPSLFCLSLPKMVVKIPPSNTPCRPPLHPCLPLFPEKARGPPAPASAPDSGEAGRVAAFVTKEEDEPPVQGLLGVLGDREGRRRWDCRGSTARGRGRGRENSSRSRRMLRKTAMELESLPPRPLPRHRSSEDDDDVGPVRSLSSALPRRRPPREAPGRRKKRNY